MPEPLYSGTYSSDFERSERHTYGSSQDQTYEKLSDKNTSLTTRESIELFQNAVDAAQAEYYKKLPPEAPAQGLKPNLTVDLRKKKLSHLPREVIALIRQDVERLQLAYNTLSHIPYEFTQCSALKYLNLRENRFKEIPKAIFGLPQLEIVDISRNKLTEVPDEIEHLKALRVLSIQHNNIQDLPYCLGAISTLRMLKVLDNPLNPTLQRILDGDGMSPSPLLIKDENERDTFLTKMLTEHMRNRTASGDSGEDSTSDGPLETPRALSRFPVQPQYGHSTSGSESASDLRSPNFIKPTLPARSHNRAPSSQYGTLHNAAPRRPGLAPLALGNERNRSNSESVLQSTQNNKVKRLGVVTKKNSDLGVLDEMRNNRNSYHLRGQSHGSALRNGVRVEDSSPPSDPSGIELRRGVAGRRLASLPELISDGPPPNGLMKTSQGILFSLDMLAPLTSTLAISATEGKARRTSLERAFHSAAMHIEQLDQELVQLHGSSAQYTELAPRSRKAVLLATRECAMSHERIMTALTRITTRLNLLTDRKYLRTFMLVLYGSLNEMLLSTKNHKVDQTSRLPQKQYAQRVSTISEVSNEGDYLYTSDRSATPTQRRKFARRLKNGTTLQQPMKDLNLPTPGFQNTIQTAFPMYTNGRSRSNSRATPLHSSTSSSVMSTPRSGESFMSASLAIRSRSGSVNTTSEHLWADKQETAQFDKIFAVLKASVDDGLAVLPPLRSFFLQGFNNANKQQYPNPTLCDEWSILANSATHCLEVTELLKSSLSNVLLNDREARNVRTFWQLAKTFLDSCGNLLLAIKEAIKHELLDPGLRHQLRPVHTSTREAARLIASSPWNRLTFDIDPQATPLPIGQLQTQQPALNGYQHRTLGSGGSAAGGSSPYTNVPATPLSAALGPAAQATVPAAQMSAPPPTPASTMPPTPGTASLERSFEGDIFQRADTYQSLQQTMIPRRQVI